MRKKLLIIFALCLVGGWMFFSPVAFYDSSMVSRWISVLPPETQESYVYGLLQSNDVPTYKKVAILEAWQHDLQGHGKSFHIKNLSALIPLTKIGGEPLNEPLGLMAAKVIIESGDCSVIGHLQVFYQSDEIATAWIAEHLHRKNMSNCTAPKRDRGTGGTGQ
ncbi:MAG: hypothetical protein V4488_06020 [Pseudomonadota bacterium]